MVQTKKIKISKNMSRDYKLYEFDAVIVSDIDVKEWGAELTDRSLSEQIKYKTCFRVRSIHTNREIDCVLWASTELKTGDKIHIWGKIRGSETQKCLVIYRVYKLN